VTKRSTKNIPVFYLHPLLQVPLLIVSKKKQNHKFTFIFKSSYPEMTTQETLEYAQSLPEQANRLISRLVDAPKTRSQEQFLERLLNRVVAYTNNVPRNENLDEHYFRALFNLTPDPAGRTFVIGSGAAVHALCFALREKENGLLTATLSNLVYDAQVKRDVACNPVLGGVQLYASLLASTNIQVSVHAARGLFSLTTDMEHKKLFATDEIIDCLIRYLDLRQTTQLAMNAAGCIANMAMAINSAKQKFMDHGVLNPLLVLGLSGIDVLVLNQVMRCLFSLSADGNIRPIMCTHVYVSTNPRLASGTVLDVIRRMLVDFHIPECEAVQENAIGVLGNLSRTEAVAQDPSLILLIVPLLNTPSVLVAKQATRVLHSLSTLDVIKSRLRQQDAIGWLVSLLDMNDDNVLRDATGILANMIVDDPKTKDDVFLRHGVLATMSRLLTSTNEDVKSQAARMIHGMTSTADIQRACIPMIPALVAIALTGKETQSPHALGALARIALSCPAQVIGGGGYMAAFEAFFNDSKYGARYDAARCITCLMAYMISRASLHGITEVYAHVITMQAPLYGSIEGERRRLRHDTRALFNETITSPLYGATRVSFGSDVQLHVHRYIIKAMAPMVDQAITDGSCRMPSDSVDLNLASWKAVLEYIYTGGIDEETTARRLISDTEYANSVICLAKTYGFYGVQIVIAKTNPNVDEEYKVVTHPKNPSILLEHGLARLLDDGDGADVSFNISGQVREYEFLPPAKEGGRLTKAAKMGTGIHAHKFILAARSPYYKSLFSSNWVSSDTIEFDGDEQTLDVMLRYIYSAFGSSLVELLANDPHLTLNVLLVANQYQLDGLQSRCEYMLSKYIDDTNCVTMVRLIEGMNAPWLHSYCYHYMLTHGMFDEEMDVDE
jgi:hypothetical protein